MASTPADGQSLRLAELIAALSLALDLGLGQPMEYFLRSCLLAVRLGEALGLGERDLADIYYLALLRYAGCTAETPTAAAILDDDLAAYRWLIVLDQARPAALAGTVARNVGRGAAPLRRAHRIARALATMPRKTREVHAAHCEVAQSLAEQVGFSQAISAALGQMFERWDGKGQPRGTKGEAIVLPVRIVQLAADAELFGRLGGGDAAIVMARQRAGSAHDPWLVERFCRVAPQIMREPDTSSAWDAVLAAEPGPRPCVSAAQLDAAARAIGNVVDLKAPCLSGHSSGVGDLAAAAAKHCGLPVDEVAAVRRAGLLHDLGRIGVSAAIWNKPGPLTEGEWERVRLHPYYTERVLARSKALAGLGALAALHHERLDGSGYHRGVPGSLLPPGARIIAVADVYHALTEPRPYRPAYPSEAAAAEVRRQVRAGGLDGEAANAVLAAAGHHTRAVHRGRVAGLSDREVVVLRLVARGLSNRQMAEHLSISPRTVHHHIEHIYDKIGVSTRASATYFAMQHDLLGDLDDLNLTEK